MRNGQQKDATGRFLPVDVHVHTQRRSIRVPDNVWQPAQDRAAREGTTVSAVVNHKLTEYIENEDET